jgi:hypothetical protein
MFHYQQNVRTNEARAQSDIRSWDALIRKKPMPLFIYLLQVM